jgi:NADH-quinone oxidoreductase subunit L
MTLLLIFLPLFTAILSGFFSRLIGQKGAMFITTLGMFLTTVMALFYFYLNLLGVPTYSIFGKWICAGTFAIH